MHLSSLRIPLKAASLSGCCPRISILPLAILLGLLTLPARGQLNLADATDFPGAWAAWSEYYGDGAKHYNSSAWISQSDFTLDGVDAAVATVNGTRTGPITNGLEVSITGPATLYYSYRAIARADRLAVSRWKGPGLEGTTNSPETSDTSWREASYQVPAGSHLLSWSAATGIRDGIVNLYVDQVWTSLDPRPRILTATEQLAVFQQAFAATLEVASTTPYVLTVEELPPGLTYDPGRRRISGTPTKAGRFAAKMIVENAAGRHVAHLRFWVEPGTTSIQEAIDNSTYIPYQSADGPQWKGIVGMGHDGVDCLRLDPTAYNSLQLAVPGPGILRYWYWSDSLGSDSDPFISRILSLFVDEQTMLMHTITPEWKQFSLPISKAANLTWSATPSPLRYWYLDSIEFIPDVPQIQVRSAAGNLIDSATTFQLGSIAPGTKHETLLTVRNAGRAALENLVFEAVGPDKDDLTIVRDDLAMTLQPEQEGTVRIIVDAQHAGPRSASVQIWSNDADSSPFVVDFRYVGDSRFTVQPLSQTVAVGTGVALTVNAELFDGSVASYQWFKDAEAFNGTAGASLTFPDAMPWNAGTYRVQVPGANGPVFSTEAIVRFTDAPSMPWRNVSSAYSFDGTPNDVVRPASPAVLENDVAFVDDPERGAVVEIRGKGFSVPSLDWEPLESRGPGGSLRLPRPISGNGDPFTLFFWLRELGYSSWHGEAFFTLGEGAQSAELLGHYGIGGLAGWTDYYGTTRTIVTQMPSDPSMANGAGEAALDVPWSSWAIVAAGDSMQVYRNGRFVGSADYPWGTPGDLFVGKHWWVDGVLRQSTRLRGRLDDVRVFSRTLTATDVAQLHTATAVSPPNAYAAWAKESGLSQNSQGVDADPDNDGFGNLDECAFGTSPTAFSERISSFSVSPDGSTIVWAGRPDFHYEVEFSYDAQHWSPAPHPITTAVDQSGVPAGYTRRQAHLPLPDPGDRLDLYLARIRAEAPPIFMNDGALEVVPAHGEPLSGDAVQLSTSVLGQNVSFQWYRDDISVDGGTGSTLIVPSANPSHTGAYHVTATNRAGVSTSQKFYILVR